MTAMGFVPHKDLGDHVIVDIDSAVKCDISATLADSDAGIHEPESCKGFEGTGDPDLDSWLTDAGIQAGSIMHNGSPTMRRRSAPQVERLIGGMPEAARGLVGVQIEYYGLAGERIADRGLPFSRVRLVNPPGGAPKYLAPAGSSNHLYVPPNFPHEAAVGGVLIITEGEKKAIVACAAGYPTVALAGVHQWPESVERRGEKEDAEDANEKTPHLKAETPIMNELLDVIEKTGATAVHVLFDSDGAALDKRSVTINGVVDKKFVVRTSDKKYVMNQSVAHAGQVFADALRRQTKAKVSLGFVPHGSQPFDNDHAGKIRKVDRLTKRGLDDWIRQSPAETVRSTLDLQMSGAVKGRAPADGKANVDFDVSKQGFVPLGFSPTPEGTAYIVWSNGQCAVKPLTDASLSRKVAFFGAFGEKYCDAEMGKETLVEHGDSEKGTEDKYEMRFDLEIGQRMITRACVAAGLFSENNKFGAGAWDDGAGGLEINCITGRFRVSPDGEIGPAERVVTAGNRTIVFPKTTYGDLIEDRDATVEEISGFIEAIWGGWNFRNPVDGMLIAGWTMLQAYTACGPVRPNLFVTGPTSAGKTALTEMIRVFVGPWSWYVNDSSNASVAFLRGQLGQDVVTVFMDEAEPAKVKSGGAGRLMVTKDHIEGAVRALRSSYNSRIITHTTPPLDDPDSREEGRMSSGGKGSASGATREERLLTSVMLSAISMPETDQADRDRMIAVEIDALTDAQKKCDPPTAETKRLGGRVFRKMWQKRALFLTNFRVITPKIISKSPKTQQTLAAAIAALITALNLDAESGDVAALIDQVNSTRCAESSENAPQADDQAILDALLSSPIEIEIEGGGRKKVSLSDAIAEAIQRGMGGRDPRGGGECGAALKLRGMSARRTDAGVQLFIAKGHAEFGKFSSQTSFANAYAILARAQGAERTVREAGRDTRVKLGARQAHTGIWIPVDVDVDASDTPTVPTGPAAPQATAESLFDAEQLPY
ncbi:DUF3854 domain-containing protein [Acidiphilium acidophilum]|uniref:DUF3854 domain-containing protein n=1 Tax=Acidiphilium acidophilum TaxID=76588 RepID=UPI002E8E68C0|nr:DUF3854 domain-containing protein [Acidiphilium acidophilum]